MLDTNILISTIYSPLGTPALAYKKASEPPYNLVLCDQIIDELRRIFNRKFPAKIASMGTLSCHPPIRFDYYYIGRFCRFKWTIYPRCKWSPDTSCRTQS